MENNLHLFPGNQPSAAVPRNSNFDKFIAANKKLSEEKGISWDIQLDDRGIALDGQEWDLKKIIGDGRPEKKVLRNFSCLHPKEEDGESQGGKRKRQYDGIISTEWQDFIKACTLKYLVDEKKSLSFVASAHVALRFFATVTNKEPWQVDVDDVMLTCKLRDVRQPSGGISINLRAVLTFLVDELHLAAACPLMGIYASAVKYGPKENKVKPGGDPVEESLQRRKAEEKLPERRAFWEIVRLVFTETPRTLSDALRFAIVKIFLMCGFREEEGTLLPFNWKRVQTYLDEKGNPAGMSGGISEALLIRHFALKQGT